MTAIYRFTTLLVVGFVFSVLFGCINALEKHERASRQALIESFRVGQR